MPPCLFLTRPARESAAFADAARAAGWRGAVFCAPLMRIDLEPPSEDALARAGTLIVTSQHAVAALAQATARRDWPVWCVGPRTAQAARAAGFAHVHQAGGDARALLAELRAARPPAPLLHLRGAHVACDLAAALQAQALVVYRQEALTLPREAAERVAAGGVLVLPVFSPRSARLLVAALAPLRHDAAHKELLAISPAARDAALAASNGVDWAGVTVAARPDAQSMCAALMRLQARLEPYEKPR